MPKLHGYRERQHRPLWNTLILRWEGCDRVETPTKLRGPWNAIEIKAILTDLGRPLETWEIVIDFGLPVDPTPIYRGPVVRF